MKTPLVVVSVSFAAVCYGQTANSTSSQGVIPQDTPYSIVQKEANSQIWERTTYERLPSGDVVSNVHRYEELATGLNYKDPNTGQWEPSSELIEPVAGGAVAQHGQHKVMFASDIATFGAIDMETPDGQQLQSHLLGLSYFDRSSGQSVFIAQVTNSIGQLVSSNQVWYDNAFTGLKAGVRYTYTRDGFEQDVILEERPPAPELYGFNSATTVLQAFTEFISPPKPEVSVNNAGPSGQLPDTTLRFGTMQIGRGRAFLMGNSDAGCTVSKEWTNLDGRQFLVEEVPMLLIAAELQALPASQANLAKFSNSIVNVVSLKRLLPAQPLARVGSQRMTIASLPLTGPRFVLDYNSVNTSQTNYTFQGDTTYFVSGNVGLYGTNTTFEGGTVIKYANGVSLAVNTPLNWRGDVYRPVLMLAKDDNTIGQSISGSTGSPGNSYYATKALYFDGTSALTNLNIQNLRVLNANAAVVINGQSNHVLTDVQIVNCADGIAATNTDFSLRNALFSLVATNFTGLSATGRVEHLTSDKAIWLNKDIGGNLFLTNCILSAVTNLGSCSTQSVATASSGIGVFQSVGGASYYLTNDSPFRDAGTTNITPGLLAELGRKTTYPPVLCINSNFNAVTTLGPQVRRDTDVPDLGYHYDPLDYVFSGVNVNSNVTVVAGTAVGWFKPSTSTYAVHLADQQILEFDGLVDAPDYFVRSSAVQEGNGQWVGNGAIGIVGSQNQSSENVALSSELRMNFTTMVGFVGFDQQFRDYSGYLIVRGNNSVLAGGNTAGYVISYYLTNCLMDNQQIGQVQGHTGNEVYLRNCTLHNGDFYCSRSTAIPVSARDCSFDRVYLSVADGYSGNPTYTDYDYNAYTNATDPFPIGGADDQKSVEFDWQASWLGRFYLPTNSVLIDAGDTYANSIGLYHFTTETNQVKEANTKVDIGYHYVALDSLGNPMDTDEDGLPDYVEDSNGDGVYDAGDSENWLLNSYNGLTFTSGLQVFTPLK